MAATSSGPADQETINALMRELEKTDVPPADASTKDYFEQEKGYVCMYVCKNVCNSM